MAADRSDARRPPNGKGAPSRRPAARGEEAEGKQASGAQGVSDDEGEGSDDVLQRTRLDLSSHPLPQISGLTQALSQLTNLQRLDLSSMEPSEEAGNPHGLDRLDWIGAAALQKRKASDKARFGDRLTYLKFSDNPNLGKRAEKSAWKGLEHLHNLSVVNASSCALSCSPPTSTLLSWSSLAALILGHNEISALSHFPSLPQLNTLVLSHNKLAKLPSDLPASLPSLKKLSITHNVLQWQGEAESDSPLPDFTVCSHLREVRISGNSSLKRLPKHLSEWGKGAGKDRKGTGLEILEAGDCGLDDFDSISALLERQEHDSNVHPSRRRVRGFTALSLKGNQVTMLEGYRSKILEVHSGLRTLDSEKVAENAKTTKEEAIEPAAAHINEASENASAENVDRYRAPKASSHTRSSTERERSDRMPAKAHDNLSQANGTKESRAREGREKRVQRTEKPSQEPPAPASKEESATPDRKIPRKRGSRGKSKAGQGDDKAQTEPQKKSQKKQEKKQGKSQDSSATSALENDPFLTKVTKDAGDERVKRPKEAKSKTRGDTLDVDRIRARAGKAPSVPSKAKPAAEPKADKSKAGPVEKQKKRKAWDAEETSSKDPQPEAKRQKSAIDPATAVSAKDQTASKGKGKDAPSKELTSVAGVVNVANAQKQRQRGKEASGEPKAKWKPAASSTAWNAGNDLPLGTGGAWD